MLKISNTFFRFGSWFCLQTDSPNFMILTMMIFWNHPISANFLNGWIIQQFDAWNPPGRWWHWSVVLSELPGSLRTGYLWIRFKCTVYFAYIYRKTINWMSVYIYTYIYTVYNRFQRFFNVKPPKIGEMNPIWHFSNGLKPKPSTSYSLFCLGGIKTCVLQNNAGCVPLIFVCFVYLTKTHFQEICGSLSSLIPLWGVETLDSDVPTQSLLQELSDCGAVAVWKLSRVKFLCTMISMSSR